MTDDALQTLVAEALSPLVNEEMEPQMRAAWLADLARAAVAAARPHVEHQLASLVAQYYRREIGRLMQQAVHWAENDKPLAVHYRVMAADQYYQIVVLMERDPSQGWDRPFDAIRKELAAPALKPAGPYPPPRDLHRYRDPRFVVECLRGTDTKTMPQKRLNILLTLAHGFFPWAIDTPRGWDYLSLSEPDARGRDRNESRWILCCGHCLTEAEGEAWVAEGLLKEGPPDRSGRRTLIIADGGRKWLEENWPDPEDVERWM